MASTGDDVNDQHGAEKVERDATISRATAQSQDGYVVRMYRTDDDRLLTYEELYDEVDAEGSVLPPEQWIDGVWDCHGCIAA